MLWQAHRHAYQGLKLGLHAEELLHGRGVFAGIATNRGETGSGGKDNNSGSTATGGETGSGGNNNSSSTATGGETVSGGNNSNNNTPAPTPVPDTGNNGSTGNNSNAGSAVGRDPNEVIGNEDDSWVVDGGDAEYNPAPLPPEPDPAPVPEAPAPEAPAPEAPAPAPETNTNAGSAVGRDPNEVIGNEDSSWVVDGGNAEYNPAPLPPEPTF